MTKRSLLLSAGLVLVLAVGCDSSDVIELLFPDVQGSWNATVTNGDSATLTGCSGDLAALEGETFDQALSSDMFCTVSGTLDVLQVEGNVVVNPQTVACDSGALALVSGTGSLGETTVSGQFQGMDSNAVLTTNTFSGTVSGSTLSVEQSAIAVSGDASGSCTFTPPLATVITVN